MRTDVIALTKTLTSTFRGGCTLVARLLHELLPEGLILVCKECDGCASLAGPARPAHAMHIRLQDMSSAGLRAWFTSSVAFAVPFLKTSLGKKQPRKASQSLGNGMFLCVQG